MNSSKKQVNVIYIGLSYDHWYLLFKKYGNLSGL